MISQAQSPNTKSPKQRRVLKVLVESQTQEADPGHPNSWKHHWFRAGFTPGCCSDDSTCADQHQEAGDGEDKAAQSSTSTASGGKRHRPALQTGHVVCLHTGLFVLNRTKNMDQIEPVHDDEPSLVLSDR